MSSISGVSAVNYHLPIVSPQKAGAEPDAGNDGDGDDAKSISATPAPGTGTLVDTKA
jgi:hypothetical protein